MREGVFVGAVIFAGVLAYVIGVRLPESAMAVVIGVMFGVVASIPTSILLALVLRSTQNHSPATQQESRRNQEPPQIIVLTPGTDLMPAGHITLPDRHFRIRE